LWDPIHGSAPKYAGQWAASPVGAIGALALLLDAVGLPAGHAAIETAIVTAFRTDRIDGVAARPGRTMEDAKKIAELVAEGRVAEGGEGEDR